MQIERHLHKIDDSEFVELAHQVVKRIQSLMASGSTQFARVEIETSEEWKSLRNREADDAYTEALLWLDELLVQL